ncbi:MAG: gliding motility-associated C-terminal domain-containing protein [Chitinophagaceae bacterium]|nr:gliding motility-associated C-terminal domain-containing protein [Chitinophagaceae bacterium]
MRLVICIFILIFNGLISLAQVPSWVNKIGSNLEEDTYGVDHDMNGNVYVTGWFKNTVDFDPGPAQFNLTSNGLTDVFLAKYDSMGQFIWAFKIGQYDRDGGMKIKVDYAGDVIITGFVRQNNIDFDPGPGTYFLNAPGTGGTDPGHSGDIFLAKYSSNAQFIWAFVISGSWNSDIGETIEVDSTNHIYFGGAINSTSVMVADADPGPGVYNLAQPGQGHAFLIKYDANANFMWAFQLGTYSVNSSIKSIKMVPGDTSFIICGHHTSTNADFDPGPGTYTLNSNGGVDMFVGRYSVNGHFMWALGVGGPQQDLGMQVCLDANQNVYVAGSFFGNNVDFNPGPGLNSLTSYGQIDGYLAKYNVNGIYQWAIQVGGTGMDYAWSLMHKNNQLVLCGEFSGTADFDPSAATFALNTNGLADGFLSYYQTNGNFICAQQIGNIGNDRLYCINNGNNQRFYTGGNFENTVDFNPSANTLNLSAVGMRDGFFGQYNITSNDTIQAVIVGDTICNGQTAYISITLPPGYNNSFNVQLNNGQNTITLNNIVSGVPIAITPSPSSTSTYTLVGATYVNANCNHSVILGGPFTIVVNAGITLNAWSNPSSICAGSSATLNASGAQNYTWQPGNLSGNPVVNPTQSTTYTVTASSAIGCTLTTTVTVVVNPSPTIVVLPNNPSLCLGQSLPLVASGAVIYSWLPSTGLSNATIANPIANPSVTTTYTITGTNANGCSASTTITLNVGATLNITTNPSNPSICNGQTIPLSCSGAATNYSWQPTGTLSNPSIANPIAFPTINTTYTVTASNAQGCSGSATILVTVWPLPNINASPGVNSICRGDSALLQLSGVLNYTWMPNQFIAMQGNNAAYVFPNQNTTYTITGSDMHNCSNTASVVVNVNPSPDIIITSVGLGICTGDSATLTAMGGINYTWEPAASVYPSTGNPVHAFPTQTTIYTVSGIDANGCTNTATYDVNVSNVLDFKVVKNRDIECGFNQAQLFASGADIYFWWPSTGLSSTNSATPIVQIDETTTYYVTGKKGSCSLTDSITVYVYKNNEASVFVPNAFSPNGDGVNDCIRPMHQANFKRYYFTVYNRFGNKVFSTYDPSECWNGQYKYQDAEVGVYFYYLQGETNCGEIFKKGDIMLMR